MKITDITLSKTISLAKALVFGRCVSKDRIVKRIEICSNCDYVDEVNETMSCGICRCDVKQKGLINLARFEETFEYGCKHPEGSQWKKEGV